MKHVNIKVLGSVQGVFYRATAKEFADKISLKGFIRNDNDGSVYIEAEGEEEQLNQFIDWCKIGPDLAQVEKVDYTEGPIKNLSDFKIY